MSDLNCFAGLPFLKQESENTITARRGKSTSGRTSSLRFLITLMSYVHLLNSDSKRVTLLGHGSANPLHRKLLPQKRHFSMSTLSTWVWVNTYRYIFSGMNIHLPAILGFTRYQGFDPSPHLWNRCKMVQTYSQKPWVPKAIPIAEVLKMHQNATHWVAHSKCFT